MNRNTDTSEKGLESLIVTYMTGTAYPEDSYGVEDYKAKYGRSPEYVHGLSADFNREFAVDLPKLIEFIRSTQRKTFDELNIKNEGPSRTKFLYRLQGEIAKRGIIDVLRKGIKHHSFNIEFFYGTPTEGNQLAKENFDKNIFSITRQLHYSKDETKLSLDLVLFINGLPIITFELKNKLTKQTVDDAIRQYKRDRDPKELIFQFGRCMVHFAVDDHQVVMCTHLKGEESWFLPFNIGFNDGTGNPPNPDGIATDYLWKEVLTKQGLTNIIENYAQIVEEKDEKSGKKKKKQVFPRYHQLDVVRKLLTDAKQKGTGKRYLIQHSAGSGKSNSITWLAHQLIELNTDKKAVFDSVIVVTDRRLLDQQIRDNIRQFAQVSAVVGAVTQGSAQLREFIRQGKRIIISTVQKFPFIVDEIGNIHRDRTFAIIIDEAHSSQGGRTAASLNIALSKIQQEEEESTEDKINRIIESRKMLDNASYFAFTATPKGKTLELFGEAYVEGGQVKRCPFHHYSMKQAIQEGFILDVLKNYTPVDTYFKLLKKIEEDPEFDKKKAKKKLKKYVEGHDKPIRDKTEIMVDHFLNQVVARRKIAGQARAMVITNGIQRAIQYYFAFSTYLTEVKSRYKAIVAFSGEVLFNGQKVTEASINGFSSNKIAEMIITDPYRFLICADKFQTGYDEPLLHSMYVDKTLEGVKAVQTLSRLNRAHPHKHDTFILDFMNDEELITKSFAPYYRTTILGEETDPDKLHDQKNELDNYQVYSQEDVDHFVDLYLTGVERDRLDPILDVCVATYTSDLDEDKQVRFKKNAKGFNRMYNFLASILPYNYPAWEKLSIFLNFLIPKLPSPKEEDLSKGILETIDMDTYRAEIRASIDISLPDEDGEVGPVPIEKGGGRSEPELDKLSNIIKAFNDQFGNIEWKDEDKVYEIITKELPEKVKADEAYKNARKNADKDTARIEMNRALGRAITNMLSDNAELFKQYSDNEDFKRWLGNMIFDLTYYEK